MLILESALKPLNPALARVPSEERPYSRAVVHIAVLGSCTLDIIFRVARFPAPGETLFAESTATFVGGKGLNQGIAAARLGAEVTLIGRVGADSAGDQLRAAAEAAGIDPRYVARDPVHPTGMAVPIVVAGGGNSILASGGANLQVRFEDVEAAAGRLAAADAFLVQFETPLDVVAYAVAVAHAANVPVILNPAPVRPVSPELLGMVDVLVVNEVEAQELAPGFSAPAAQAAALRERGPRRVVVTLGPDGCVFNDGSAGGLPAFPVAAIDTVGAGDAFCGALAVSLATGLSFAEACRFASAAAAISVTRAGAAPSLATRAEVEAFLAVR